MTRIRCVIAMLIAGVLSAEASAQFFPPPVVGMPVVLPNGIDFHYKRGGLRINGFIPTGGAAAAVLPVIPGAVGPGAFFPATYYPYAYPYFPYGYPFPAMGAVDQRITVTVTQPALLIQGRTGLAPYMEDYDLSGIDLDVESAAKIWGKRAAVLGKAEANPQAKPELARVVPPAEKKLRVAAEVANMPQPPIVRKPAPALDGAQLVDSGSKAFRAGEFALALRNFRDAAELTPNLARAWFLQAHTTIAMGRLSDAVVQIEAGLKRNPHFHLNGFRPKTELYADQIPLWAEHLDMVKKAHRQNPKNADALFLLGYLAWYDGDREAAVGFFEQARPLVAETRFVDLFLKSPAAKQ